MRVASTDVANSQSAVTAATSVPLGHGVVNAATAVVVMQHSNNAAATTTTLFIIGVVESNSQQ